MFFPDPTGVIRVRLRRLELNHFGPFEKYTLSLAATDRPFLLLTGKNNEGKSNIIFALRLLHAALKVVGLPSHRITLNDVDYYRLPKQDVGHLTVGRLVHDYGDTVATVRATLSNGAVLSDYLDPVEQVIYADYRGTKSPSLRHLFGFSPTLGAVAEEESYLDLVYRLEASHVPQLAQPMEATSHGEPDQTIDGAALD